MNSIKSVINKESGKNTPDDQVAFYEKLFVENPNWSSNHPNDDEAARWECITSVLSDIKRQSLNSQESKYRIIDVGCGRGWLTNLLTEYGSVEGVEPVAPVINHARRLFPNIKFYHGDAQTILTSPSFLAYDIAVCSEVLEHVNDSEKKIFVDKLIRLLKPAGHLIITTPRREAQDDWLHYCGAPGQPVEDWLDEKQVEALFTETGLKKTNLKRVLFEGKTKSFINNQNTKLPLDPKVIPIYQVWSFQKPFSQSFQTEKLLEAARNAVNEGKINDALESLLEALTIKSDCQDALLILAEIDNQSEGVNNYHKWLQQASNERPEDPKLAFKWAIIANKAEDSEAFEQALDRVLRLQPTHRGAHHLIADTFMLVKNYGKAAPFYNSLAAQDPSDIRALLGLSQCLIYGAEWESAVAVLKAALAAEPDNLIATAQLGEVQNQLAKSISKSHLNFATIDLCISEAKFDYLNTPATEQRPKYNYVQKNIDAPPRVSIITPFYNIFEIFHETARSIMRQSMQDFEWIIINDGTNDPRSLEVLNKYRLKNNRIRVVDHETNLGLSAARNTGFREARTNYVVQLDGDDLLEPTAVEKWFWYLESHPDVAFVNSYSIGFGEKCYQWNRGFDRRTDFLEENQVPAFAMIRRTVHEAVGGYDEKIRGGLEDWDYWLRCANANLWGKTIGEFHSWYRRRGEHSDRWSNLQVDRIRAMREKFRIRYSRLWDGGFPLSPNPVHKPYAPITTIEASTGVLAKINRRLILVIPWMTVGGADKFNLDLIGQLCGLGWEITVVGTLVGDQAWMGLFAQLTPDIFVLPNFLEPVDYPQFFQHLVYSRQVDVIIISHSEWGYRLLPFLRSHCPNVALVDYCHIEEESWNNGGYPRYSIQYQEILDLTMVSSYHLKGWMQSRGAQNGKVVVCTTNVDPTRWKRSIENKNCAKIDLGLRTNSPVILFAARMVPQKQPVVLAETLLRLNKQGISYTALVVGGGPEENWLKDFVANHNLGGQVKILGAQSNETVAKLLGAADVFFLPSINEGIALSLYEAMGAGVAVVGADVGGQSELVDTDCGFLIKPINPEEDTVRYVNIFRRLLISPDTIKKMGAAGRARIENGFSLKMMGEQVAQILEQSCKVHHKSVAVSKGIGLICTSEAIELDQSKATDPLEVVCVAGNILAQAGEFKTALQNYRFARGLTQLPIQNGLAVQIDSVISQLLEKQEKHHNIHQQLKQSASNLDKETEDVLLPLVSIVIICFKQAHLLGEAVNSVLWQHYKNWELIIVNDGSPDNVGEIAQDLIEKNRGRSIYLVNKPNGGQADARNSGFAHASGSLYLPLDADDCLHPNYLKLTVAALQKIPGAGVAFTDIQHFGSRRDTWSTGPFTKEVMSCDNRLPYCSLYRRALFDSVGGYSNEMRGEYEDWDFWLAALEKGWTAIKVAEPLFLYRKQDGGMLQIANSKREELYQKIVNRHPIIYNQPSKAIRLCDHQSHSVSVAARLPKKSFKIVYLISSIQGVTGGNQTLLGQTNKLSEQGHEVYIVTYSNQPSWISLQARIIKVPGDQPLAKFVPTADIVVATYFTNAIELERISVPVKVYYAQGDQYIFDDSQLLVNTNKINSRFADISKISYQQHGIYFVANSRNLADAVERKYGRRADGILPVCTDRNVFYPSPDRAWLPPWKILIVGPDSRGTENEPLSFKGIEDIKNAVLILGNRRQDFEIVRMSNTQPEIFQGVPCKFYIAPSTEVKTQLYGSSHILIYASHYDSCPRPPQEGMAAGVAVVCTNTPGAREYCKDGENSLLVPICNPTAIADAVEVILNDSKMRERLIEGGLVTAAEFSSEREWKEWENLLGKFYKLKLQTK